VNPFAILFLIRLLMGNKAGDSIRRRHLILAGKQAVHLVLAIWLTSLGVDLVRAAGLTDEVVLSLLEASWIVLLVLLHLGPEWLAWRELGPRGWVRTGRGLLRWATAGRRRADRTGPLALFSTLWAAETPDLYEEDAGPWTAIALVLDAERRGEPERARALAHWIDHVPPGNLLSWRLRTYGIEVFARSAARAGDWREVARRVRLGRGRGVRFLRKVAAVHEGKRVSAAALWWAWALAPGRKEGRSWRDAALATITPGSEPETAREATEPSAVPWLEHLRLLDTAAAGRPLALDRVARLADAWQEELSGQRVAQWMVRGLELGARAPSEVCREIRGQVMSELDALVEAAQGGWPEETSELAAELMARRRGLLLQGLSRWTTGFPSRGGVDRPIRLPVEEWTDWVAFHDHVFRVASCGRETLQTAWHNGLRLTACNWPVHLQRAHGEKSHWAACVMYAWAGWFAAWAGDDEIQRLSESNFKIARTQLDH